MNTPTFLEFLATQAQITILPTPDADEVDGRPILDSNAFPPIVQAGPIRTIEPSYKDSALVYCFDQVPGPKWLKEEMEKYIAEAADLAHGASVLVYKLPKAEMQRQFNIVCGTDVPARSYFVNFFSLGTLIPKEQRGNRAFLELPPDYDDAMSDVRRTQKILNECYYDNGEHPEIAERCVFIATLRFTGTVK